MQTVKTIKFKNLSEHVLNIDAPFDCTVPVGGELDVLEHLAEPRRMDNGGRGKSVIEMLAPQMKPVDKAFAARWAQVPAAKAVVARTGATVTVQGLLTAGVPRAVAEAIVAGTRAKNVTEEG